MDHSHTEWTKSLILQNFFRRIDESAFFSQHSGEIPSRHLSRDLIVNVHNFLLVNLSPNLPDQFKLELRAR